MIWLTLTLATVASMVQAEIGNKRIPSGFQGMRGKKSVDYASLDENPIPMSTFDRMSLIDSIDESRLANLENALLERPDLYYGYQDHVGFKRAPMGFQGMRGKKTYLMDTGPSAYAAYADMFDDDYLEKRAPSFGFQGMRGKREFEYAPFAYSDKRAPSGFQGMRGKKSDDESHMLDELKKSDEADVKAESLSNEQPINGYDMGSSDNMISVKQRRAQSMGFFGVRGKKMPAASSFFGMRGKKGPYDLVPFRGKFVGVRGKKLFEARPSELQMLEDKLTWNGDSSYEKRKGPSGFVGMRGKKWIAPGELKKKDFTVIIFESEIYNSCK